MKITNFRDIPSSVYRLQLNGDFPLKKALEILPYLKELGVEGIYSSPFYDAYTSHGYDVTNPNRFNSLIGTNEEYEAFFELLKKLELMLVIDVIPNHMGIKGGKNLWWQDVLENGPYSQYASFFDINWSPEKKELQDRVLLPILGDAYGKVLERQEIQLTYDGEGTFMLHYMDFPLPVRLHGYALILDYESEKLKKSLGVQNPVWKEYQELIELYSFFPTLTRERAEKKTEARERLASVTKRSREVRAHLNQTVKTYNGKKRDRSSFDLLDKLLEAQFYRLSYWKVASHEINYRRFFNIHELVAIRIEEELVLNQHHHLIFELMDSGRVQGLRIDHPDGLYDPIRYFERVRKKLPIYTVVEKILDRKEELPELWQVEGTVGYEFLNILNGLFINPQSEKKMTDIYEKFIGKKMAFEEILYQSKKRIATHEMVSEVGSLGLKLDRLSEASREYRDFTRIDLTTALSEVIACFPVYRTYIDLTRKPNRHEAHYIKSAVEKAKQKAATELDPSIFDFLEKLLLMQLKTPEEEQSGYREFVLCFQQLTGPMMAKGLEDTAFYIYNRFISLNEVGGDAEKFGMTPKIFHEFNRKKKEKWPFGFLASSTHDTKRNEDARQRLNVLSEIPNKWEKVVASWAEITKPFKTLGPTPNTEYMIYQLLLAIWPRELKAEEREDFLERFWQIVLKSIREQKEETCWMANNQLYEEAVKNFIFSLLNFEEPTPFLDAFLPLQKLCDYFGAYNSLSATVLKMASCGVVDIYQGNEILHYRLVDPDNRAAVDFDLRQKSLFFIRETNKEKLLKSNDLEKIKQFIHWKMLHFRTAHKSLFLDGDYVPLEVIGRKKNHVIALMRRHEDETALVFAGRFFALLTDGQAEKPLGKKYWQGTEILLPQEAIGKKMTDLFTGKAFDLKSEKIEVSAIFEHLPVSCFEENSRTK